MDRREKLEAALKVLGEDKVTIAARLKREKIKGYVGSGKHCPIACYLYKQGFEDAVVLHTTVYGGGVSIPTPDYVVGFMIEFDMGVHKTLLDLGEAPDDVHFGD